MKESMSSKKNIILIIFLVLILIVIYLVLLPTTIYRIGNVFFEGNPTLYNVNFAQHFFRYASYPAWGEAPPYAHHQLSRTYFIKGEFNKSVQEALLELEEYPDNTNTYYILGLTYGYMSREEEAIEAFSKFIEANPASWAARNDKAWLQFRIGDINGALETITPVINDKNPWVMNTYGTILMNHGRREDAKKAFSSALKIVSNMTEADWGVAYPGNDPRIYATGLKAMKKSILDNLKILESYETGLSPR